ncbi:MAG: rhodanese-like domain-containing protein [Candidatus Binatia bacterium]
MKSCRLFFKKVIIAVAAALAILVLLPPGAYADPSKYPQFAQQSLPDNVPLVLINIEELVAELKAGVKPVIIDVRTEEEYREVHILGAVLAPLAEFKDYLKSIPRDRPVVLY